MWQTFKRLLLLQTKMLEIRLVTWRNRRAIARAYKESASFSSGVKFSPRLLRRVGLVAGLVICAAILYRIAPAAGRAIAYGTGIVSHSIASVKIRPPDIRLPEPTPAQARPVVPPPPARSDTVVQVKTSPVAQPAGPENPPPPVAVAPTAGEPFGEGMEYCILANKANKILYFLGRDSLGGPWHIVEQCPAVMGMNEGQKRVAGDRRTPEGTYFIIGRKDGWELNAIYGPLAYVLNYPNEEDRKAGRTGQGIWIHGMPEDSSRMVTHGCIVLQNGYLLGLAKYLRLGIGTPVVIVDKNDVTHPELLVDFAALEQKRKAILDEYRKRQEDFTGLLSRWKHAWESKDIDTYSGFYDKAHFVGGGLSWKAWKDKKTATFEMYKTIGISLDKIRVVDFSESTAVVVFQQQYESDVATKQNSKKLSLIKSGGQWLITREETFSNQEFFL